MWGDIIKTFKRVFGVKRVCVIDDLYPTNKFLVIKTLYQKHCLWKYDKEIIFFCLFRFADNCGPSPRKIFYDPDTNAIKNLFRFLPRGYQVLYSFGDIKFWKRRFAQEKLSLLEVARSAWSHNFPRGVKYLCKSFFKIKLKKAVKWNRFNWTEICYYINYYIDSEYCSAITGEQENLY